MKILFYEQDVIDATRLESSFQKNPLEQISWSLVKNGKEFQATFKTLSPDVVVLRYRPEQEEMNKKISDVLGKKFPQILRLLMIQEQQKSKISDLMTPVWGVHGVIMLPFQLDFFLYLIHSSKKMANV